MSKNGNSWVSQGAPLVRDEVTSEGESENFYPVKWEISLKYLSKRWSNFSELKRGSLKRIPDLIEKGQRGGPDSLKHFHQGKIIGRKSITGWKNLRPLCPDDRKIDGCVYCRLGDDSRIYFAIGEDDNSGGKLYMLAVDPHHKIAP